MFRRLLFFSVVAAAFAFVASPAFAKAKKPKSSKPAKLTKEDKAFQERLASLKKDPANLIVIKMAVTDDPARIPETDPMHGLTLVANNRQLMTPETLSPQDMLRVINKNMVDVRKCYKKQLEADPEWNDELILDLAVKKTGRVSEVAISPRRVRKDVIGTCLMSTVPKWKFPEFTGESDEGVTQEVVNASFPFSMSPAD